MFTAYRPRYLLKPYIGEPFRDCPKWHTPKVRNAARRSWKSLRDGDRQVLFPTGIASGVMKGLGLRYEDMNRSTLAGTAEVRTTTLSIGGMSCGACARHLTSALEGLTGVVHVEVDLKRNRANVEHLPDRTDENTLIAAIEGAGYTARVEATRDEEFDVSESTAAGRSTGCCCR